MRQYFLILLLLCSAFDRNVSGRKPLLFYQRLADPASRQATDDYKTLEDANDGWQRYQDYANGYALSVPAGMNLDISLFAVRTVFQTPAHKIEIYRDDLRHTGSTVSDNTWNTATASYITLKTMNCSKTVIPLTTLAVLYISCSGSAAPSSAAGPQPLLLRGNRHRQQRSVYHPHQIHRAHRLGKCRTAQLPAHSGEGNAGIFRHDNSGGQSLQPSRIASLLAALLFLPAPGPGAFSNLPRRKYCAR